MLTSNYNLLQLEIRNSVMKRTHQGRVICLAMVASSKQAFQEIGIGLEVNLSKT